MNKKKEPKISKSFKCFFCRRKQDTVYYYTKKKGKKITVKDTVDCCDSCDSKADEKGYRKVGFKP